MTRRLSHGWFWPALIAITIAGIVRIVGTYDTISQSSDEPFHLMAGLEWLEDGTYTLDPMTPPPGSLEACER